MAHQTTKITPIDCRLALFMSSGALAGAFVSTATPAGPLEAALRALLRSNVLGGLRELRISWRLSAAKPPREERARLAIKFLEMPKTTQ